MLQYYYIVTNGVNCGHRHRAKGAELARCWREQAAGGPLGVIWHVQANGKHMRAGSAEREVVRGFLSSRPVGRPPSLTGPTPRGKALYARLKDVERDRFEAVATAFGFSELGSFAVRMLELISDYQEANPGAPLPPSLLPGP